MACGNFSEDQMVVVSNRCGRAALPASARANARGLSSRGSAVTRSITLVLIVIVVALVVIW